jgi:CheY-specific phosphatase CheX
MVDVMMLKVFPEIISRMSEEMLGIDAVLGEGDRDRVAVTSFVEISGDWRGRVVLEFSPELSVRVTRKLFDLDLEEIPEESLVADAIKELANVTGGTFKSLVSQANKLSIPFYSGSLLEDRRQELCNFEFSLNGEPLIVRVLQNDD